MLASFLREASSLLVEVKTMEIKKKRGCKRQNKKSNDEGGAGEGGRSRKGGRGKRSKKDD